MQPEEYGDAAGHHPVLAYIRGVRAGTPADPAYERKALTADLELDTLDLAELLLALGREKGMDADAIAGAMQTRGIKIPGAEDYDDDRGGWSSLPNLVRRAGGLGAPDEEGRETFNETDRRKLLASGAVGPGNEIRPFSPHVTVGFLLKYLRALGL